MMNRIHHFLNRHLRVQGEDNATREESDSSSSIISGMATSSREELEEIQQKSWFNVMVYNNTHLHISMGPTHTKMGCDGDTRDSPYMDRRTGTYGIPIKGRYWFRVGDKGVKEGGDVEWFLCRGDGRKEKMTGREPSFAEWYMHDYVEWECEEGETVWVEGVGVGQDVEVERFQFFGKLLLD